MSLREQILRAENVDDEDFASGPDERLLVRADIPESLLVEDEQECLGMLRWLLDGFRYSHQQQQQHREPTG